MSATADVTRQKITREFDIKLGSKEIEKKAHQIADLDAEVKELEQQQKESNAKFKTQIEERYAEISKLCQAVRTGVEVQTLDAEMVKDFNSAQKKFYVKGELIHEEAMTPDELQMEFGDEPKPNSPEDLGFKKPKRLKVKDQSAKAGRKKDAEEAEASKKRGKAKTADVVKLETNRKTKRASTDGVYT